MQLQKPRLYDKEIYTNFGEQPNLFEIQIGSSLNPLVDEGKKSNLQKEITYCRNRFDAEYGLPVPAVHIRENMCLEPYEYLILFNGVELEKCSVCPDYKTGYSCISPEEVIGTHLYENIWKNRTRILNQNLVNTLVEKVRKQNPDVISNVFFYHSFTISKLKILLNFLLEEEISIRDMNTILETIADNIRSEMRISELMEIVHEHLAYNFIRKYVDENNVLHVLTIQEKTAYKFIDADHKSEREEELPFAALKKEEMEKMKNSINSFVARFREKNLQPVIICPQMIRQLIFSAFHDGTPDLRVVSIQEVLALGKDIHLMKEGEISLDD